MQCDSALILSVRGQPTYYLRMTLLSYPCLSPAIQLSISVLPENKNCSNKPQIFSGNEVP